MTIGVQHRVMAGAAGLLALIPVAACAEPIALSRDQNLDFGTVAVASTGSRTLSPAGAVTDSGVFSVSGPITPAQFTITYDRGFDSTTPVTVTVLVLLSNVPSFTKDGVTGTLSNFTTDLAGLPLLIPSQSTLYTMPVCTARRCSKSFRIGAKINFNRSYGGAKLSFDLPVTVALVAAL